jgi:hypothetical protein
VCADIASGLRARIEGWSTRPEEQAREERRRKEKILLALHHHRGKYLNQVGEHVAEVLAPKAGTLTGVKN